MVYSIKAAGVFLVFSLFDGSIFDQASILVDVVAIAAIFGSVTVYNRTKAALSASESAGRAWHEEKEAAVARADRVAQENVALQAKAAALEARPDLTVLQNLVKESTDSMLRHEVAAAQRTDRLIGAIEQLPQGGGKP